MVVAARNSNAAGKAQCLDGSGRRGEVTTPKFAHGVVSGSPYRTVRPKYYAACNSRPHLAGNVEAGSRHGTVGPYKRCHLQRRGLGNQNRAVAQERKRVGRRSRPIDREKDTPEAIRRGNEDILLSRKCPAIRRQRRSGLCPTDAHPSETQCRAHHARTQPASCMRTSRYRPKEP